MTQLSLFNEENVAPQKLKESDFIWAGNVASFDSYRSQYLYYTVLNKNGELFLFTVPLDDTNGATFLSVDKVIFFKRWIRKAIESNTMVKYPKK